MIDLFTSYDKSRECKLSLSDLENMIKPSFTLRHDYNSKNSIELSDHEVIDYESNARIQHHLKSVFEKLIEMSSTLNQVKNHIRTSKMDLDELFEQMDKFKRGYLN